MGFQVIHKEEIIWSPGLDVGNLFLDQLKALEKIIDHKSGIDSFLADELEVDQAVLEPFINIVLERLEKTNSGPYFALVQGSLQIAIALNAQITGRWPAVSKRLMPIIEGAKTVMRPIPL